MVKKPASPWCRGVEGQEHDVVYIHRPGTPNCQPLRSWVREYNREFPTPPEHADRLTEHSDRQEAENWECFHHKECRRCRRNLAVVLYADECPVARGLEPAGAPDPVGP